MQTGFEINSSETADKGPRPLFLLELLCTPYNPVLFAGRVLTPSYYFEGEGEHNHENCILQGQPVCYPLQTDLPQPGRKDTKLGSVRRLGDRKTEL